MKEKSEFQKKVSQMVKNDIDKKNELFDSMTSKEVEDYLIAEGWYRTEDMELEGTIFGPFFSRDGCECSMGEYAAFTIAFQEQIDRERKQSFSDRSVECLCNKCESDLMLYDTNAYGDKIPVGYHGLVDAVVNGGYYSEHLSDTVTYRFSLCEKCLLELFETFKKAPEISCYMP